MHNHIDKWTKNLLLYLVEIYSFSKNKRYASPLTTLSELLLLTHLSL